MSDLPLLNQRVKMIIDTFYKGNVTAFARAIGYNSPQKVNRLFKIDPRSGKYPEPSTSIIVDISNKLDGLNQSWLMSGEGTMMKGEKGNLKEENRSTAGDVISASDLGLVDIIRSQQRTIESLTKTIEKLTDR